MDLDTIRWLLSVGATVAGGWFVIHWRVTQLESAVAAAKMAADLAIAKAREEVRKEMDTCWAAVHQGERNFAKHMEEAYAERLLVERRFTDVMLAQNTTSGEVKSVLEGVRRLEVNLKELADEVKKN